MKKKSRERKEKELEGNIREEGLLSSAVAALVPPSMKSLAVSILVVAVMIVQEGRYQEFNENDQVMLRHRVERLPPGTWKKVHAKRMSPFCVKKKALDTFNTAVVSPIYYAMFTSFTILASSIMFKDWSGQSASDIISVLCGFITVLSGTTVLHSTREPDPHPSDLYTSISPQISWHVHANGEIWKNTENDELHHEVVGIIRPDYFK